METDVTTILRLASKRGLPSLLIGGNALVLLGYIRDTVDLDLLVPEGSRSHWLDLMRDLGYRLFHGTSAFAQFETSAPGGMPLDLMFMEAATWEKLVERASEVKLAEEAGGGTFAGLGPSLW